MSTIELVRPKVIDLEELFEIRIWIAPTYNGVVAMTKKRIMVGQKEVFWKASETIDINGMVAWIEKEAKHFVINPGSFRLSTGDTLKVTIHWRDE